MAEASAAAAPAATSAGAGAAPAPPPKGVSAQPASSSWFGLPRPQTLLDWVLIALVLALLVVMVETLFHVVGIRRARRALALRAAQRTSDLRTGSTASQRPRTEPVRRPSSRAVPAAGRDPSGSSRLSTASSRQAQPASGRHAAAERQPASGRVAGPPSGRTAAAREGSGRVAGEAPRLPAGFAPFRVDEVIDETADVKTFRLLPAEGGDVAPWLAGQFISVAVMPAGADKPALRCYSLSEAPQPGAGYQITVKSCGAISSHLHGMRVGDLVQVRKPAGSFIVDPATQKLDVALIAGGIGLTPLWAMARALTAAQSRVRIDLFFGVRTNADVIFARQLRTMAAENEQFRLHLVLSRPPADGTWQGHSGHVDVDLIRRVLLYNLRGRSYFLCGPTQMMDDLTAGLVAAGVAREDIRTESFGPAAGRRKGTGRDDEESFAPSSETAREAVAIYRSKEAGEG